MALPRMGSDLTALDRVAGVQLTVPVMPVAPHPQRATPPPRQDRFAVEWALPDDEIGPADVVLRVCDTDVKPGDSFCVHCPVCDNHQRMQSAVTADGERYDRCLGCGRLWHVDPDLGRVVGARFIIPR
jgi:hypothetical protein